MGRALPEHGGHCSNRIPEAEHGDCGAAKRDGGGWRLHGRVAVSGRSKIVHCPHCGCDLAPPKTGKPRSVPQHRRLFALIRAAYMHWPETQAFRPVNEGHLRKWLQAKAGYHTVTTIETDGMTPAQSVAAIAAALSTASSEHPFVKAVGTKLHMFVSRSIDFDTLPHLQACALFDAVAGVIEAETGIKADDMITHTPRTRKDERLPEVSS